LSSKSIEQKVEELLLNQIIDLGYELYDVIYVKEGKDYYLRIIIDSENGISLEDCEKVSNSIDSKLDEVDYIKEQYFLEVSSPGIERTLRKEKHYEDNIGKKVQVNLYNKLENGEKQIISRAYAHEFKNKLMTKGEHNYE
jgi:ribosome maturation factor RimP